MTSCTDSKLEFPLTQEIAGWITDTSLAPQASMDIDTPGCVFNTRKEIHHLITPGFGCAGTAPLHKSDESLVGLIIGAPRWTDAELRSIAVDQGDSAALLAAYTQHGENLACALVGDFAFAVVDPGSRQVLLGIDRMGRHALYYHHSDDVFLFGTCASSVNKLRNVDETLQAQGIYNYVYFHMLPSPTTIYQGIYKLQSGSTVQFRKKQVEVHRYWRPEFREKPSQGLTTAQSLLKTKLREAVKNAMPKTGKVGAFLSGGLDSSTVAGMLAEVSDGPCHAYSIGFSAKGYDEMAYARITAKHFDVNLHEYYVTPDDVVAAVPFIATSYDEPFGNSSALPAYFCARMAAEDDVSLLLAGDGGDEIFAGNERYAKQGVFEKYQGIPGWLRNGFIEPLLAVMPRGIPLVQKGRSYVQQANTQLPDRLQTYNFLHQYPASEIFEQQFLENISTNYPLELQRDIYRHPETATKLNRMLFLDWQYTLADNDLRKVSHMCALAGIDVAYPMLDDDLVEFSLGIPSDWKLKGDELRKFYKESLSGWLPDATISKNKQGFGLPFGVWMRSHQPLRELAYDSVLKLRSRGIFNNQFLEKSIQLHKEGHASYFGELIWILMVLELWLDKNRVAQ